MSAETKLPVTLQFDTTLQSLSMSPTSSSGMTASPLPGSSQSKAQPPDTGAACSTTPETPPVPSQLPTLTSWDDHKVKTLLALIKDNKELLQVKNKKPVWKNIAQELSVKLKVEVTGDQCYDKFRKVKQVFRKHEDERKKTGNNTPRPFKYDDMYIIVGDDPTLTPLYACDSEGNVTAQDDSTEAGTGTALSSDDESSPPEPPRKKVKSRNRSSVVTNEIGDILVESQQKLQDTLITMHTENKELLSRLIDKL